MLALRRLRKKAGLTQEQLAAMVGVEQPAVAMWESGLRLPTADKLPDIAKALNCTIDALMKPEETPGPESR